MVSRNELSLWKTHTHLLKCVCRLILTPHCFQIGGSTLIRVSRVVWSWFLDRTGTLGCSGSLEKRRECCVPTPVDSVQVFAWVNTLGERSRFGLTVAATVWGDITRGDIENSFSSVFTKKNPENAKGILGVFTVLTGICIAAFLIAVVVLRSGAGHSARAWVGPRKRGASPGHGRGRSLLVSLCSCWTSCSFRRSSWGDKTPGIWEEQPDQTKKKTCLRSINTYLNMPRQLDKMR